MSNGFDQSAFDRKALSQIKTHHNLDKKYDDWVTKNWDDLVYMYNLAKINIDMDAFCMYIFANSDH